MRCQLKIVGQQKRERKLTGLNTLPAVRRTKGLSKSRGASRLRTGPAQPEAGGRGEGKGANSAPKTASPTTPQTGLQFLTKDFLRFLDGRHPLGRLNTGRRHPTSAQLRLGPQRGEGALHPARVRPSNSWLPELPRLGKAQNAGATEPALLWRTRKLEPHATEGMLHLEQPGARAT